MDPIKQNKANPSHHHQIVILNGIIDLLEEYSGVLKQKNINKLFSLQCFAVVEAAISGWVQDGSDKHVFVAKPVAPMQDPQ